MQASQMTAGTGASSQPITRARVARALRRLRGLPGWRTLVNRLVPAHSGRFVVHNGRTAFAGDISSFIDRQVYLFGGYESSRIVRFLSCVPRERRGTILDIGANVGTHSLAFARVFRSVHAFEPNPVLWAQFERNMELNRLVNVKLHKLGLADRDDELTLHLIDKPNFGLGTFSTQQQYDLPLRAVATCPIRHAATYLAAEQLGPIDAVKIDVQGFEPEVLRGMHEVLKRDRPIIWCELGPGTLEKISHTDALETLLPYPFRCFQLAPGPVWRGDHVRLQERSGELRGGDYVFVPT